MTETFRWPRHNGGFPATEPAARRGLPSAFPVLRGGRAGIVDFHASQPHFIDHLAPLWLEAKQRGIAGVFVLPTDLIPRAVRRGLSGHDIKGAGSASAGCVVCASIGDVRGVAATGRRLALLEHGCGLSFSGAHPGHSGGGGVRAEVSLFLMTNEYCAARDRAAYPKARVVTCGAPKLDVLAARKWVRHDPPVIGYATHWDCMSAPETRSALPYYHAALKTLADRYRVVAHTHPRSGLQTWQTFSALGLDTVRDWADFLEAVDLLVCDCGSAPYEFAFSGRPVVVLNCPLYRKTVHHGLRFWENVPGLQVDDPRQLTATVERALQDPENAQRMRQDAVRAVYPHRGHATKIAVDALEEWANGG
jgi:hypothetical protein